MTFDHIENLLKTHDTIRLLRADNAPLILGFLAWAFKEQTLTSENGSIGEKQLSDSLSDYLYRLREEGRSYPKQPIDYLTDWANAGFLRKFAEQSDTFLYELTPATEQAFKWLESLTKREFVGTESRLKYLFERIRELVAHTQMNAEERLLRLERQKQELERNMEELRAGKVVSLDERQVKEEYYLIEDTAQSLLGDFRQVEQNFRDLDRDFRRKIITTTLSKGEVLTDLFEQQDFLSQTDQGKSFAAFWEFILSPDKQQELENLVERMLEIPAVGRIRNTRFRMELLRNYLIEAGDRTNKTTNSLWSQLRRYLEHKSFFENKRIHEQITEGLKLIVENPDIAFTQLPALVIEEPIKIDLIADRPLFQPKETVKFKRQALAKGRPTDDNSLLYEQFEINLPRLKERISTLLRNRDSISLTELLDVYPVEKGIAEVVAYLDIASRSGSRHTVEKEAQEEILIRNAQTEQVFKITLPKIRFNRS